MVTTVSPLHSCILGSGKPTGKPSYCSAPLLGQILISAGYIPIWGYCRLIVNDGAALSDSFLGQD